MSKISQNQIQTVFGYYNQYIKLFIVTCHAKNRILAKNRRYAKMRENDNSHTLANWLVKKVRAVGC